jgi:hypothetical protein
METIERYGSEEHKEIGWRRYWKAPSVRLSAE